MLQYVRACRSRSSSSVGATDSDKPEAARRGGGQRERQPSWLWLLREALSMAQPRRHARQGGMLAVCWPFGDVAGRRDRVAVSDQLRLLREQADTKVADALAVCQVSHPPGAQRFMPVTGTAQGDWVRGGVHDGEAGHTACGRTRRAGSCNVPGRP